MPPPRSAPRSAMVLTAGGAKGAYAIGVMKALFKGRSPATGHLPLDPQVYAGSSVGAYSAVFMSCRPDVPAAAGIDVLEQIWRTRIAYTGMNCGNGVFRIRGLPVQALSFGCFANPLQRALDLLGDAAFFAQETALHTADFLRSDLPPGGRFLEAVDLSAFFDPAPLHELMEETIDLQALAGSSRQVTIVASRWTDGRPALFDNQRLALRPDLSPLMASTAIPGIFPPVAIDGIPYVDGGLAMDVPLKPAIDAGAESIYLVYVDPFVASDAPPLHSTFDVMSQVFAILSAERVKADLRHAQRINDAIDLLARRPLAGSAEDAAFEAGRLLAASGAQHRKVAIHIFRPTGRVGTGGRGTETINFSSENIDALIDLGYREAVEHDCTAAGCVVATPAAEPAAGGARWTGTAQKGR